MNRWRLSDGLVVTLSALIYEVLWDGKVGLKVRLLPPRNHLKVPICRPHGPGKPFRP